jgi:hypothetical protein
LQIELKEITNRAENTSKAPKVPQNSLKNVDETQQELYSIG